MKEPQKYYRPSETQSTCCAKTKFHTRFPEMNNDLSNRNFFSVMCSFIGYSLTHQTVNKPTDKQALEKQLPMTVPDFITQNNQIKYTWIGHSTAVICLGNDANIMIDPVFYERCSPSPCVGPKRYRPPACEVEALPKIDAVFVSHDHYDHLDANTLEQIYTKNTQALFFAGLGSQDVFPDNSKLKTLDWTEKHCFQLNGKKFSVTFVPVCHWGRRGLNDKNQRLWGGFVIETPTHKKIFYAGDTGYCGIFEEIGKQFQEIDLAILPIGAYFPREMFRSQHIDPEQAVIIHKQLHAKKSVGVHWGTFPLTMQHYLAPREDLEIAKKKHGLKADEFITVGHGENLIIDYF